MISAQTAIYGFGLALAGMVMVGTNAVAADDSAVSAGEYVATVAGCGACHTGPSGETFAGGHVLQTPFGELATPNITQDKETGIGGWTKDDFVAALRQGLNEDGLPLYPAMPYVHYTKMTDEDIDNLWAYVQTVPPVHNEVKVNRLPFPFDVRPSLFGWQLIFFDEGRFKPDGSKDAVWNRGAYIVEALAHCGACHTPRDALGGPISSRSLQGAHIENWYAPDISNGPNSVIADWDVKRLEDFLSGNDGHNHVAVGSMTHVVDDLKKTKPEDVHAIAVYLKDQKTSETPRQASQPMDPAVRADAETLFADRCASCHNEDGTGKPGVAASLVGSGAVLAQSPANVISVLVEGIEPQGEYGVMPSFRDTLSDEKIADLANYVRTSWGNDAPANATPENVAGLRNVTNTNPGAAAAATCPNVATDVIGADMRSTIADLVKMGAAADDDRVRSLLSAFKEKNPDATESDTVVDLGGVFCQEVAKTGVGRGAVISRQLVFMNKILAMNDSK